MEKEKYYGTEIKKEQPIPPNLNKYNEYTNQLQDDLRIMMDKNISLSNEITEIEEERQYYLGKIMKVMKFCEEMKEDNIERETKQFLSNITQIIKHVPEDFK